MTGKNLNVLFVEDNLIEIMKMQRTIPLLEIDHKVDEVKNANEALVFLRNNKAPDIILLDLNMPKISGIDFLSFLRSEEKYKYIPVIILTTSNNPKDLHECYKIGISGYVVKPLKYQDYIKKIKTVLGYWSMNELNIV